MEPLQVSHSSKYKTISNPATVNQSENSVRVPEEAKRDTPSSSDNSEEAEGFLHIGSPIAVMWYDFLMHPRSSLYAMCWSIMLCSLVILRIIAILLESCNGPNQYYKRDRVRASYYFLLSEPEYFQMYVACFTPLLLDTAMRIVLVLLITFESENYPVYRRFVSDRTELVMFACDVICVIPFLVSAVHLAPRDFLSLSQAESITLSIMELLMTSRIFRLLRNIPAIRAVSIALTNSFEHLVLPIFFFFAFNITTGVFFYFAEPCYDLNVCPWTSLFQSSFYSIVTMTTTGYGNQVPSFILSRGVAVSVMLFGSLYLSMPLAIIGNEYDKAWNQVQEEEEILRQQRLAELTNDGAFNADKSDHSNTNVTSPHGGSGGFSLTKMGAVDKKVTPLPSRASTPPTPRSPPGEMTSQPMQSPSRRMSAEEQAIIMSKTLLASSIEDKRQRVRMSSVMVIRHSLIDKLHHLHAQYKAHPRFIAPSVMIGLCELRAWLPTLVLGIEEVLRSVSIFETRLASQPSPSNLISAPAPSVPAPAPVAERRRYSVIGRGGAVINRSAPASTVVPQYTAPSTTLTATSANYTMIYSPHHPYSLPPTTSTSTYNKAAGVGVGVGSLPPLLEASRRNSKNTSNNNNNSINNRKNSNNNTDPYNNSSSTATTATTRRRSSNNNNYNSKTNNTSNSNNNVRKVKTSEDIDDSDDLGSLGSLGSFAFSSDEELEDNEDFDHVLQHLLSPPPLPPSSSLHMSSSVDSSSHSALSQAAHVTTNNAIVMSPPRPSMSLAMSQRESQIPEEKSGSDSEEEEEEEDSNDDDDVETGKRGHVRHNSNLSQQSNSSWKKRYVAVQPSPDVDHRDPRRSSETSQKFNGEKRKETVLSEAIFIEARQRARTSMYNRLVHMLKAKDPELRRRTLSEDAMERLKSVAQDPLRLRNRLWILLEFPHSSREARALQILLIFLICLSIFIMYTQTITSLTLYGESQPICGSLLELYCWDKDDASLDPGCFVQNMHGATSSKLQYNCDSGDCFGHGLNFGSGYTNMTCSNTSAPSPFQTTEQLQYSYGTPLFITSRNMMQRVSAICSRIECTDNSVGYYDASPLWIVTEFVMNAIFLVELVLRVLVAQSLRSYVKDIMNFFDCLAILPFLLTIFVLNGGSISSIDFSILASSPYNFTIVLSRAFLVFRLFKLTRHFRASKVLFETAKIVWRQILGMLALLALMVLLFSIILFELEKGDSCYVGDKGCIVPPEIASEVQTGDLIFIGKKGLPSTMPNIFYGVWFSYVTATTTGYGDIVPVTNGGQLMGIFLMLFGTFYMAMPLTAAATTFYNVHEKHAQLGTVTPIPAVTSDADSNKENPAASDAAVSEGGATTHIPSFTQPQPHPAPPLSHRPSIRRPSVIGDLMRAQITSAIKELRSFDRLIEEVITDLHSSPICFFDEALMRQEERKYSTNSDTFSALDDVSSIKSGASLSQSQKNNSTPPRQMHRMRRNIAKLCKGLEDVMRGNEAVVIDLLFLHHAILHGELEHTNQKATPVNRHVTI